MKTAEEYLDLANSTPEHKARFIIKGKELVIWYMPGVDVSIWTDNGNTSLYSAHGKDTAEARAEAIAALDDYLNKGLIHCAACGTPFPESEAPGYKRSWFAGKYCQHCWDTEYKAKEANTNYD